MKETWRGGWIENRRIFDLLWTDIDGSGKGSLAFVLRNSKWRKDAKFSDLNLGERVWEWAMWLVDFSACAYDSDQPVHIWSQATELCRSGIGTKGKRSGPYASDSAAQCEPALTRSAKLELIFLQLSWRHTANPAFSAAKTNADIVLIILLIFCITAS